MAPDSTTNGGTPVTGYEVWWKKSSDATYTLVGSTTSSTTTLTKAVTSPGTIYDFVVLAKNDAGSSPYSPVL